jgi:hypothetical protein
MSEALDIYLLRGGEWSLPYSHLLSSVGGVAPLTLTSPRGRGLARQRQVKVRGIPIGPNLPDITIICAFPKKLSCQGASWV